jgi:hypothetical protein
MIFVRPCETDCAAHVTPCENLVSPTVPPQRKFRVRRMLFGDPEPQCTEAGTQTEPQPTEHIQELEGSDDEDEEDEEDELEFRRSWTAPARYNNYSGGNAIGLGPP